MKRTIIMLAKTHMKSINFLMKIQNFTNIMPYSIYDSPSYCWWQSFNNLI